MLSDCVENGCKYLVMETSSQALKYGRTAALDYTVSAFLNISEDHISDMEHPDFEDYFDSKLKIFRQSKIACVNMDMEREFYERVMKTAKKHCQKVITFGSNVDSHDLVNVPETADFYGYDIKATSSKLEFKLKHQQQTEQITVNIGGKYYIKGQNFTEYSKVTLNGETLKTIYLGPSLLGLLEEVDPADAVNMKVSQIDKSNKEIISTTE